MTKLEILQREDPNSLHINLYKEGMFWKAYELSAYRFVFGIMKCKAKAHHFKEINHNVVHIGVPDKTLLSHKDLFRTLYQDEKNYIIEPLKFESKISFEDWKKSIEDNIPKDVIIKRNHEKIIQIIKDYNLADSTPFDCMVFLANLKKSIDG